MKPSTPKTELPYQIYDCSISSWLRPVKNLLAMHKTQIWSLGQEDPLEKGVATHSSILAWKIPWTEEPGGLQSTGSQRVGNDWVRNTFTVQNFIPFGALSDLSPVLTEH